MKETVQDHLFHETRGYLDLAALRDDGTVHAHGWVASLVPPAVVRLEVRCGRARIAAEQMVVTRLPSPDVAAAFPRLCEVENARFAVEIRRPLADCLVEVTPVLANGARGVPVANLLAPRIPLPSDAEALSVGGPMRDGFELFGHLRARAGLAAGSRVLDVGCGVGRVAYPIVYLLDENGSYDGFDIVRGAVAQASRAFAARPRVRFRHVDLRNTRYNPAGTLASDTFAFPYDDASFDLVFATSVITHMLEHEVRHYLDEVARVLAPGGRALLTCFLLNEDSERRIAARQSSQELVHACGIARVADPAVPEASIGFPDSWMRAQIGVRGLDLLEVCAGGWCGREDWISYQDMLVLARRAR